MLESSYIKELYGQAEQELNQFRPMMYDIYSHTMTGKNNWNNLITGNIGQRTDIIIYNVHPQIINSQFSATMVSLTIPTGTKFFKIASVDKLDDKDQFLKDMEPITDTILAQLNSSNFYQVANESFMDLNAGTGGMLVNYDKATRRIYFTSLDMSRVSFLEDNMGIVNYVFRKLGILDKNTQKRLYPDIDFGQVDVDALECVYPCNGKFMHIITDTQFTKIYTQDISDTNPFIIFRWSKRPNENRGRGILNDIIGLIKVTNRMVKDIMDASALIINPPIVTNRGSILNPNNIKLQPNSIIELSDNQAMFKTFPVSPNLPFAFQEVASNNATIDSAFMQNILGSAGSGTLTATEVNARMQLASNVLGSAYNRIQREFLNPLITRVINLLESDGWFDIPVTTIIDRNGKQQQRKLKLTYSSPIVDANETIDAQKLMQAIQATVQATGQPAYVSAGFKLENLPFYFSKAFGARMDVVNTPEETTNNLQQAVKMKQQQQMSNPALQGAINTGVFQGA
jgi:hypothetical protein